MNPKQPLKQFSDLRKLEGVRVVTLTEYQASFEGEMEVDGKEEKEVYWNDAL